VRALRLRLGRVTNDAEARLRQGYRVVRLLGTECPWAGALVCGPTGATAVAVDAAVLGDDWWGWNASATGHILGPLDVLRRTDGHDVLLPVCTEPLAEFLDRRSDLSAGEGVTVAVSLLRGLGEIGESADDVHGAWWLTEDGRPVFASDTVAGSVVDETLHLLERITAEVPMMSAALSGVAETIRDPRRRARAIDQAERALFAAAAPLPLATTNLGPKRVRSRLARDLAEHVDVLDADPPSWAVSLSRHLDADWADLVSRMTTGVWRALRAPKAGGRKPWLVAGGLAGCVLVAGLLWPTGTAGPALAESAHDSAAADPSSAPDPSFTSPIPTAPEDQGADQGEGAPVHPSEDPVDLTATVSGLLTARTACDGEVDCLAGLVENADTDFPAGVIDVAAETRTVTLLDDFGGAAVARVDAAGGGHPSQLVVVVLSEGRWLLRDVYAVAEQ
jgi:hypothetical protein